MFILTAELAQKSASLPGAIRGIDPASIFALEQEAGGEVEGKDIGFKEPALYRQSTRRLKERIIQQYVCSEITFRVKLLSPRYSKLMQ